LRRACRERGWRGGYASAATWGDLNQVRARGDLNPAATRADLNQVRARGDLNPAATWAT
jgi:hypothetical protein